MSSIESDESASFGDDERQLCPDSACIGVLGPDLVCPECGAIAKLATDASIRREPSAVDLLHRSLCPDGACIGILGADGRCRECGRVGSEVTKDPRLRGLKDSGSHAAQDAQPVSARAAAAQPSASPDLLDDDEPLAFADRRLCPDGSCIGVIGDAGTCKECGRVA